jgi:hypothetical protein
MPGFSDQQKAARKIVARAARQNAGSDNAASEDNDDAGRFDPRARHAERTVSAPALQMAETEAVGGSEPDNDSDDNE